MFLCFVDYTKAFDTVSHDQLWVTMIDMDFPIHIVDLIRKLYIRQQSIVRTLAGTSTWFSVKRGARQGCILSPYLFNLYAERATREALDGYDRGFRIGGREINNLRYADDIVLIATSVNELQQLVDRVRVASQKLGLIINTAKTKVMVSAMTKEIASITVNGQILEQVSSFVYLGAVFTDDSDCSKDIRKRLAMGRTAMQ